MLAPHAVQVREHELGRSSLAPAEPVLRWLLTDGRLSLVVDAQAEGMARLVARRAARAMEPERCRGTHRWLRPELATCVVLGVP